MSIAIALNTTEGVLLCADTLYTGDVEINQTKLFPIEYEGGCVAFVLAGHEGYSKLAIQESKQAILDCPASERSVRNIKNIIASTLKYVYVEHIDPRPPHEQYESQIDLLVSIWSETEGLHLFVTRKTALIETEKYECLGSGAYLAYYIISPVYSSTMNVRQSVLLALQAMAGIKQHDPHCGGRSELLFVSKTGRPIPLNRPLTPGWLERGVHRFQGDVQHLLFMLAQVASTDEEYGAYLNDFKKSLGGLLGTLDTTLDEIEKLIRNSS